MLVAASCAYCNGTIGDVKVVKLRKSCVVEAATYAITLTYAMTLTFQISVPVPKLSLQHNFVTSVVYVPKPHLLQQPQSMSDELARRTVNLDASYQSFDDIAKKMQRCVMPDCLLFVENMDIFARQVSFHACAMFTLLGMLMHAEQ